MIPMRFILTMAVVATVSPLGALAQGQSAPSGAAQQQKFLVLRGGLLIDGTGGTPLKDPVVVISGNKIQSVGTLNSVTIPADATVIDTSGKTILPGLVDSHVHLRNFQAPLHLYWGVTTVGDLGNPRGWILAYRDAVAKGRAVGPYIMASGPKLNAPFKPGGDPAPGDSVGYQTFLLGNSARVYVTDQASVDNAVSNHKKAGVDVIKLYLRMEPPLMKLAAQAAHRAGYQVFAHFTSASSRLGIFLGTDEILDTGIDVHVHLFGLVKATAPQEVRDRIMKGERVEAWHLLDTSKFPPLVQKMVEKKMFLNPTLGADFEKASKHLAEFDRLNTPFVKGPIFAALPEVIRNRYVPAFKPFRGGKEAAEELEEGYEKAGLFVKQFVDQGGKVIAGADSGPSVRTPGLTLHMEMQMLNEVGLTPMQAIQAATSWATEAWGKSKEVGTLEAGKRADILVLNRNPLEDLRATTDISQVIQGGKVVDREGLAKWRETVPRPGPMQEGYPNASIHAPFIDEISPDSIPVNRKNGSEVTITGENFSNDSLVLINDRLVPAKSHTEKELRISIPSSLKKSGLYPLVVVNPGSAGGVSNLFFLLVTPE